MPGPRRRASVARVESLGNSCAASRTRAASCAAGTAALWGAVVSSDDPRVVSDASARSREHVSASLRPAFVADCMARLAACAANPSPPALVPYTSTGSVSSSSGLGSAVQRCLLVLDDLHLACPTIHRRLLLSRRRLCRPFPRHLPRRLRDGLPGASAARAPSTGRSSVTRFVGFAAAVAAAGERGERRRRRRRWRVGAAIAGAATADRPGSTPLAIRSPPEHAAPNRLRRRRAPPHRPSNPSGSLARRPRCAPARRAAAIKISVPLAPLSAPSSPSPPPRPARCPTRPRRARAVGFFSAAPSPSRRPSGGIRAAVRTIAALRRSAIAAPPPTILPPPERWRSSQGSDAIPTPKRQPPAPPAALLAERPEHIAISRYSS